jgi:hypothetical protein
MAQKSLEARMDFLSDAGLAFLRRLGDVWRLKGYDE